MTAAIGRVLRILAVLALVPLLALTSWIWFGFSRPSVTLVFEGFQMWLLAPAWPILAAALVRRRWLIAAFAGVVAVSHLCFCIPAATADSVPTWAHRAPTMTLFVGNVRYDNPNKPAVAREVLASHADVIVLNEMTVAQHDELAKAGVLDRYPTQVWRRGGTFGEMLLTRLPATDAKVEALRTVRAPAATVTVGDRRVRVYAVHVYAPKDGADRPRWRSDLRGIGRSIGHDSTPHLYVGDFNSAPWHGPFRALLDSGLTDSHDALGLGLTRSWTPNLPGASLIGPLMRLDHALFTSGLFPRRLHDVTIPGSDHRGFALTIAVGTRRSG